MAVKKQGEPAKRRIIDKAFKIEALRILKTSGRTLGQVADDLGIGHSTLSTWRRKHEDAELLAGPHDDLSRENARLRRENELLRAERDLLKKATAFFAKETSR